MTLKPGTKLGRYEIRAKIGAGGMGEVYLARDAKLDRKVALKILPTDVATHHDRMHRFEQEAKAASALNHPNIITIYEIEQINSLNLIATEFIDGATLREHMRKNPLKLGEVLDIGAQIASALAAAHAAGIIHRDIKPENIMIRRDGIVKVLDFGLAKLTEPRTLTAVDTEAATLVRVKTDPGVVMGTAIYMSPEQARGLEVDARTDIFSVGVLIYEALAGHVPFEGSNANEIIAAILSDKEPPLLARYVPEAPAEFERIVAKALRKSRDERYQTAKDLLLDLKALKQELEFTAKLERSAPPQARVSSATASAAESHATIDQLAASTVEASKAYPTSSAEYVITGIKQHKLVALAALVVIAGGIAGLAAYLHARNTEVAIESIAVLPFTNQNRDPDSEYLSDGLTESIINSLTQLPNLKVIARSSVFRYKGKETDPMVAGKELGVGSVLTGRILQRGDSLTISTELLDVRDNKQLWGEQYHEKTSDLLSIQREIAKEITGNLRLKLSRAEQSRLAKHYTESPEAYQLYLKGRFYWNKRTEEGVRRGIEYFQQAIEKDPTYALAYTGIADCYSLETLHIDVGSLSPSEAGPKAKAAAMKALEMDDTLAEAHTSLAFIKLNFDWDWAGAEREFKRAIELNPNHDNAHHWHSHYLMAMGRTDESLAESKRALELDPLSLILNVHLGWHYTNARQYDLAIEQLRKALEMDPNFGVGHWYLGLAYEQEGKYSEAENELRKAKDLLKDNEAIAADIGRVYAVSGKKDQALKVIDELKELSKRRYVSSYHLAMIYNGLRDKDQAFEWLENAYRERSDMLVYLKVEPRLDSLRSDQRFADLVRRVGLPQ
jgi:serine/threonine-protein kinase